MSSLPTPEDLPNRCRNCSAPYARRQFHQDWEAVCPECEQLLWLGVGDVVTCQVTRITPFGIVVELGDRVEGLVHVSELSRTAVKHPKEAVTMGEHIMARVLRVDCEQRKIGLSRKRAGRSD